MMRIFLSMKPTLWYIFGILGTKAILRIWFQNLWKPSWWSGRSWMSKNWGFGGFWVSWWGFCQLNPHYDTFLESLGPKPYSGYNFRIFGNHPEDQEGHECPKTGVLKDFEFLDGDFVNEIHTMIHFRNRWEQSQTQDMIPQTPMSGKTRHEGKMELPMAHENRYFKS